MHEHFRAPAFAPDLDWVNVAHAPRMDRLRGRVVLLHFWAYGCVNCANVIDDLKYLETKHHDGLSVIGVHTPKFTQQRQTSAVLKAVNRLHIRHPVVNDQEWKLWREYAIKAWPSFVLIDAEGFVRATLSGEDRRGELDDWVEKLLDEAVVKDIRVYDSAQGTGRGEPRLPLRFPHKVMATERFLYVSDTSHNRVLECTHEGRIVRQFGSGNPGFWDGKAGDAGFNRPMGMAIYKDMLYVADAGNHAIRRVRLISGDVGTCAGTGKQGREIVHESVAPNAVSLNTPWDVICSQEKLYIACNGNHQIWMLDLGRNVIGAYLGSGALGRRDGLGEDATFAQPSGMGQIGQLLFVVDSESSSVRAVRLLDGRVETLVGQGLYEFGDRDGPVRNVQMQHPMAIVADPSSSLLWIADSYNSKIKALSLRSHEVRSLRIDYRFHEPAGLSLGAGSLWVANTNAHEIVRVDLTSGKATHVPVGET